MMSTEPSDPATEMDVEQEDEPPEQHAWGEEENPVGIPPKGGYPSLDPRHEEHPFDPGHK